MSSRESTRDAEEPELSMAALPPELPNLVDQSNATFNDSHSLASQPALHQAQQVVNDIFGTLSLEPGRTVPADTANRGEGPSAQNNGGLNGREGSPALSAPHQLDSNSRFDRTSQTQDNRHHRETAGRRGPYWIDLAMPTSNPYTIRGDEGLNSSVINRYMPALATALPLPDAAQLRRDVPLLVREALQGNSRAGLALFTLAGRLPERERSLIGESVLPATEEALRNGSVDHPAAVHVLLRTVARLAEGNSGQAMRAQMCLWDIAGSNGVTPEVNRMSAGLLLASLNQATAGNFAFPETQREVRELNRRLDGVSRDGMLGEAARRGIINGIPPRTWFGIALAANRGDEQSINLLVRAAPRSPVAAAVVNGLIGATSPAADRSSDGGFGNHLALGLQLINSSRPSNDVNRSAVLDSVFRAQMACPGRSAAQLSESMRAFLREHGQSHPELVARVVREAAAQARNADSSEGDRNAGTRILLLTAARVSGDGPSANLAMGAIRELAGTDAGRRLLSSNLQTLRLSERDAENLLVVREVIAGRHENLTPEQGLADQFRRLVPDASDQQMRRWTEAARVGGNDFARSLACLQMWREAAAQNPDIARYLHSNEPIGTPAPGDNILARYQNGDAPAQINGDMAATLLDQLASGGFSPSNRFINNIDRRLGQLADALQRQAGQTNGRIQQRERQHADAVLGLQQSAGAPRDAQSATLNSSEGPHHPNTLNREQNRSVDTARAAEEQLRELRGSARQQQNDALRALGIRLVGTHSIMMQTDPRRADALAVMAFNYLDRNEVGMLPHYLRNQVQNGSHLGPAMIRLSAEGTVVPGLPDEGIRLVNRMPGLPSVGNSALVRQGYSGTDLLFGLSAGRISFDAAQFRAEARAAQQAGAVRAVLAPSDRSNERMNMELAGVLRWLPFTGGFFQNAHLTRDAREYIRERFGAMANVISPQHGSSLPPDRGLALGNSSTEARGGSNAHLVEIGNHIHRLQEQYQNCREPESRQVIGDRLDSLRRIQDVLTPGSNANGLFVRMMDEFRQLDHSDSAAVARFAAAFGRFALDMAVSAALSTMIPGAGVMNAVSGGRYMLGAMMAILRVPAVRAAVERETGGVIRNLIGAGGDTGPVTRFLRGQIDARQLQSQLSRNAVVDSVHGATLGPVVSRQAEQLAEHLRLIQGPLRQHGARLAFRAGEQHANNTSNDALGDLYTIYFQSR